MNKSIGPIVNSIQFISFYFNPSPINEYNAQTIFFYFI